MFIRFINKWKLEILRCALPTSLWVNHKKRLITLHIIATQCLLLFLLVHIPKIASCQIMIHIQQKNSNISAENTVILTNFLVRKLCLSTKFPQQQIRWNYSIFRSVYHCMKLQKIIVFLVISHFFVFA